MDTISRENNSMLPVGGIIVGVIALALGLYAAVSLSKVNTKLTAQQEKIDRIDDLANQVSAVSQKTDQNAADLKKVVSDTQNGFNTVAGMIGNVQATVKTLEESQKHVAVKGKGGKGGAVVAGPGEYVVKPGDTPHRIAAANGCTTSELLAVNPGLDPKRMHVGQKLKLPEKGGAAPAEAAPAAPAPAPATP
jgi:LysM repeat protein